MTTISNNIKYIEQYLELDLPYCGLTFGQGDCNGNLNETYIARGVGYECFNCVTSCYADRGIFEDNVETKTIRFVMNTLNYTLDAIPILASVDVAGQKIFPGQQLSARQRASFTLNNIAGEDQWLDKNIIVSDARAQRGFNSLFLSKFHARYPDIKGVEARYVVVKQYDDGTSTTETDYYIVDSCVYNGKSMVIDALDVLTLLDDDQQTYPASFISEISNDPLLVKIDISKTATLPIAFDLPYYTTVADDGFGNTNEVEQYLQQYEVPGLSEPFNVGEIVIGSEILAYTRTSSPVSGTIPDGDPIGYVHMSITKRGLYDSKVSDIKVNSTVMPVGRLGYGSHTVGLDHTGSMHSGDMFAFFCKLANIPSSLIATDHWLSSLITGDCAFYINRTIAKPLGLKTLVNQLIADVNLEVFSDTKQNNVITFRPLNKFAGDYSDLPSIDQSQMEQHSVEIDYNTRISTLLSFYGYINPLEQDKEANYYGQLFYSDTHPERTRQHLKPVLKRRFNNWMGPQLLPDLQARSRVVVSQYNNVMKRIRFETPITSNINIGDGYRIYVPEFTNIYGEDFDINDSAEHTGGPYKIIEVKVKGTKAQCVAELFNPDSIFTSSNTNTKYVTIPASTGPTDSRLYGIHLRNMYDAVYGATPPVSGTTIIFQMENPNWWVSNPKTFNPYSVVSGDWPVGVILLLQGVKIYGRAGYGYSHHSSAIGNIDGGNGGNALLTTVPMILRNSIVKGAGGGGGTNKYTASTPYGPMEVFQNGGWGLGGWYTDTFGPFIIDADPPLFDQSLLGYYKVASSNIPSGYYSRPDGGDWGVDGLGAAYSSHYTYPYPNPRPGGDGGIAINGASLITLEGVNDIEGPQIG